jgi:hypothetical protein
MVLRLLENMTLKDNAKLKSELFRLMKGNKVKWEVLKPVRPLTDEDIKNLDNGTIPVKLLTKEEIKEKYETANRNLS